MARSAARTTVPSANNGAPWVSDDGTGRGPGEDQERTGRPGRLARNDGCPGEAQATMLPRWLSSE